MKTMHLDRWQGNDEQGRPFGYVAIGDGGYFVTWRDTLDTTLDSLDPDTQAPPPDLTKREQAHMRQLVRNEWRRRNRTVAA